jgi:hypothetical protein
MPPNPRISGRAHLMVRLTRQAAWPMSAKQSRSTIKLSGLVGDPFTSARVMGPMTSSIAS